VDIDQAWNCQISPAVDDDICRVIFVVMAIGRDIFYPDIFDSVSRDQQVGANKLGFSRNSIRGQHTQILDERPRMIASCSATDLWNLILFHVWGHGGSAFNLQPRMPRGVCVRRDQKVDAR